MAPYFGFLWPFIVRTGIFGVANLLFSWSSRSEVGRDEHCATQDSFMTVIGKLNTHQHYNPSKAEIERQALPRIQNSSEMIEISGRDVAVKSAENASSSEGLTEFSETTML
jgi:hypothetical protein